MKSVLNLSHCTVIKNLETFQRAQQCFEEIRPYVWDVLRDVQGELPQVDNPPMPFELNKDGYLQANAFPKSQGTDFHLISVGIENFDLTDLIGADGAKGCRAFIYSILFNDPKRATQHATIKNRLRGLQPPPGYDPAHLIDPGYLFVKKLGAIPAESVCSRSQLKSYFADPLNELAAWLEANGAAIAELQAPGKK